MWQVRQLVVIDDGRKRNENDKESRAPRNWKRKFGGRESVIKRCG